MSEFNIIKDLLGIQEENIEFTSGIYTEIKKTRKCQFIDAKLTH